MPANYDVVIIGGGHNALIAAAYLSKAGLGVCVIEQQDIVGGSVVSRELTLPGFKSDWGSTFHETLRGNPLMENDELGLKSRYGLEYIMPTGPVTGMIFPDDRALLIYPSIEKTCESIAQFSRKDAEIYPRYCEEASRILAAANIAYFSPPPSFGTLVSFLEASEAGREYLRAMLSSPVDIVEEWFESEQMQVMIYHMTHPSGQPPYAKGSGLYSFALALLHNVGRPIRDEEKAPGGFGAIAIGGSGALPKALEACIKDLGGTIMTSSEVKAVKVENGEARGVILANGEEIIAGKAVVSGVNIKQLFIDMLKPEDLPSGLPDKVRQLKHSFFVPMRMFLALENAPAYRAGGDTASTFYLHIAPLLDEYMEVFESYRKGIPCCDLLHVACLTLVDPSRAPAGKHELCIGQDQSFNIRDGGPEKWDDIKEEIGDAILKKYREHTTNMGDDNILARRVVSPLDYLRGNSSMICGDFNHINMGITQLYNFRPLYGMSNYRTPVKKLYLCGASTHPGGGVTGHGRITAQVMMEDLGIDFKKVLAK